jgi:hypothetical protein
VLLAARFPKPDVRDLIRRLPPAVSAPSTAPYMGSDVVAVALFQTDSMRSEGPRTAAGRGAVKPLSVDRFSVNFTADGEFRELR